MHHQHQGPGGARFPPVSVLSRALAPRQTDLGLPGTCSFPLPSFRPQPACGVMNSPRSYSVGKANRSHISLTSYDSPLSGFGGIARVLLPHGAPFLPGPGTKPATRQCPPGCLRALPGGVCARERCECVESTRPWSGQNPSGAVWPLWPCGLTGHLPRAEAGAARVNLGASRPVVLPPGTAVRALSRECWGLAHVGLGVPPSPLWWGLPWPAGRLTALPPPITPELWGPRGHLGANLGRGMAEAQWLARRPG